MVRLKSGKEFGEIGGKSDIFEMAMKHDDVATKKDIVEEEMRKLEETYARADKSYLELLLESYRDQIQHLKSELKQKDDIIFDLIFSIGHSSRPQRETCPQIIAENPQRTDLVLSSPALRNVEQNSERNSKWIKPVKTARNTFASATKPTVTSNRFAELRENEWLNDDDASNKDVEENKKDVQLVVSPIRKPNRRPNVVTEQNPEVNSSSAYRKVSNSPTKSGSKRSVAILGDSMLKDLRHHELAKTCTNERIYLRCFPGADIDDMAHYCKPTAKHDPDLVVLHFGTNSLRNDESPEKIANDIASVAVAMKNDQNNVVVSSIICRGDSLRDKADLVNQHLYALCGELQLGYSDNSAIQKEHLTCRGRFPGLNLNKIGSEILFSNIVNVINT